MIYPDQIRTIDPYAEYNSNVINRLTRMITRGANCIDHLNVVDVISDSTSALDHCVVTTGQCYKDDTIIQITSNFRVNMNDSSFYLPNTNPFNEAGYYYILLTYTYVKSKPAPQASITILKPSQTSGIISANYVFLKAVHVSWSGSVFEIDGFYNSDPNDSTKIRIYSQVFCGYVDTLPTFNPLTDQTRIIYVKDEDVIYFGGSTRWESIESLKLNVDTTSCTLGQLAYINPSGVAIPAIATNPSSFADGFCLAVNTQPNGGLIRLYGKTIDVPIETSITINVGDKLYLSAILAGSVTNLIPTPYSQYVGKCISVGSSNTCQLLFMPGNESSSTGTGGESFENVVYQDLLLESIFKYLFMDSFNNSDYINSGFTTATLNVTTHEIEGTVGKVLVSNVLTDVSYDGTCITEAQISANTSNNSNVSWFISNDDGSNFEYAYLNTIHMFATVSIPVHNFSNPSLFDPEEWVLGSISGKMGMVECQTSSKVLLSNVTGTTSWINGEVLTGQTSGYTCTINGSPTLRSSNVQLVVKALFGGTASIYDYGVLYDVDTTKDETSVANEKNIETLYGDIYEVPSLNSDGLRLEPFTDSTSFPVLHIVHQTDTITRAIARLDDAINGTGSGNVTGAASSTDSDIVLFDGTSGKVIKDSGVKIASISASGAASGDLSGTYPSPSVVKINGVLLSGLATGLLKLTGGTPSIASSSTDYVSYASQAASKALIAPSGSSGAPTFRNLVSADLPTTLQSGTIATTPATNDNSGLIATTALVQNVISSGFSNLQSTNGYQKFAGGLIMQWGSYTGTINDDTSYSVTFSISFPSACVNVQATCQNSSGSAAADIWMQVKSCNQTGAVLYGQSGGAGGGSGFYWFAIGY